MGNIDAHSGLRLERAVGGGELQTRLTESVLNPRTTDGTACAPRKRARGRINSPLAGPPDPQGFPVRFDAPSYGHSPSLLGTICRFRPLGLGRPQIFLVVRIKLGFPNIYCKMLS